MKTVRHVTIRGDVQGVGFRYFVLQRARNMVDRDLSVEGWVRNRRDGSVEALFVGEADAVAAMIEACRKGPIGARVEALEEREADAAQLQSRPGEPFCVLATA